MPCLPLGIPDDLGKQPMQISSPPEVRVRGERRSESGMDEADALFVHDDDMRFDGGAYSRPSVLAQDGLDQRDGGRRGESRNEKSIPGSRRKRGDPLVEELAHVSGD